MRICTADCRLNVCMYIILYCIVHACMYVASCSGYLRYRSFCIIDAFIVLINF